MKSPVHAGYDKLELDLITNAKLKFGLETKNLLVDIISPDPFVKMKAGCVVGEESIIGWAETVIDASVEECAAYTYIMDNREKMKHFENSGGLERVITKLSDHCQINRTVYDLTGASIYRLSSK